MITALEPTELDPAPDATSAGWLRLIGVLAVVTALVMGGVWIVNRGNGATATGAKVNDGTRARPVVGQAAPDFTGTAIDGTTVTLSSLRGHPVWLIFNATWCADCRAEAPEVQALSLAHADAGLEVVAVYLNEDASVVQQWTALLGLTFTHIPDPDTSIAARYNVPGVPTHYFVDATGTIRSVQVGTLSHTAMAEAISALGA